MKKNMFAYVLITCSLIAASAHAMEQAPAKAVVQAWLEAFYQAKPIKEQALIALPILSPEKVEEFKHNRTMRADEELQRYMGVLRNLPTEIQEPGQVQAFVTDSRASRTAKWYMLRHSLEFMQLSDAQRAEFSQLQAQLVGE